MSPFPSSPGNVDEWMLSPDYLGSAGPGSHPRGYRVIGTSDILWQNTSDGSVDLWKMAGATWNGSVGLGTHPGNGWQIAGSGDFNGDHTSDVLWFDAATGQTDIWELANGQRAASVSPGPHLHQR